MDINTVYSVMYEKQCSQALHIKCRAYFAGESPKYDVKVIESIDKKIEITELKLRKLNDHIRKYDFQFGGLLLFRKPLALEKIVMA